MANNRQYPFPGVRYREGDRVRISVPEIFREVEPCRYFHGKTGVIIGSRLRFAELNSEDVATKPMHQWREQPHFERLYFVAFDEPAANGLTETETPVNEFWLSFAGLIRETARKIVANYVSV